MSGCEDCGCHHFEYGDRVQLVQNPQIKGQIIGERDWGTQFLVRFATTMCSDYLDAVELEPDPENLPPERGSKVPPTTTDNVIHVAFGAQTETMGAA